MGFSHDAEAVNELFETSKRRLELKKMALEDMKNEYDLLETQALNQYKTYINYDYYFNTIEIAYKWYHAQKEGIYFDGTKIDKRKKYSEKTTYDFFVRCLNKVIGEDIDVNDFLKIGYSEIAYSIRFTTSDGKEWCIDIPIIHKIDIETFRYYREDCFKIKLYTITDGFIHELIFSTFDERQIKNAFEDYRKGE